MLKFSSYGRGYVYFKSDVRFNTTSEYLFTETIEDGTLFVKKTDNDELFTYGFIQGKDTYDHHAGYIWSSRTGVINKEFGTDYVEIIVNSTPYAISAENLKKYLPDYLDIEKVIKFEDEVYYNVVPKK